MKLRQWMFLLLAVAVAAICIRLGIWQLDRLEQRRAQNAAIRAGLAKAPLPLSQAIASANLSAYQRVTAVGTFDPGEEILLSPRAKEGQPGVHLVTPLQLSQAPAAILVERGWIPSARRQLPARAQYALEGNLTVTGYLRPGGEEPSLFFMREEEAQTSKLEWTALNIEAIESQVGYPLVDWVLVQTELMSTQQPQPIPQPDPDLAQGPHLGYALQWFSFATIAIIGGGYWLWRQRGDG